MRPKSVRVIAMAVLLALSLVAPAQAANVRNDHSFVTGYTQVYWSDCPWVEGGPNVCHDTLVEFFQHTYRNDSRNHTPWAVFAETSTWVFQPDGSVDIAREWGFTEDVAGELDSARQLSAWFKADVPMSDGSSFAVDLQVEMTGEHEVSGYDGPFDSGLPDEHWGQHLNDGCLMQNWFNHQAWRYGGNVTGTVGGTDVSTLYPAPWSPFMEGRSVFTVIVTEHGINCVE